MRCAVARVAGGVPAVEAALVEDAHIALIVHLRRWHALGVGALNVHAERKHVRAIFCRLVEGVGEPVRHGNRNTVVESADTGECAIVVIKGAIFCKVSMQLVRRKSIRRLEKSRKLKDSPDLA